MRGRVPIRTLQSIVSRNASTYNIHRRGGASESSYGGGVTYQEGSTQADIFCFDASERRVQYVSGVKMEGSLRGLCADTEDVIESDRLDYGDARYEVETKVGIPNDNSPSLYILSLTRV